MRKFLFIVLAFGVAGWWFKDPTISVSNGDVSLGYVVKYSSNAGRSDTLPMLVALHGNGDTAKHFYETALDQINVPARIILIKGPLSHGTGNAWPWRPDDFAHYGKPISEAIEMLTYKYPTVGKPVLLGFSGGGMMAYYQAVKYGDTYSYIFPVSGELSNELLDDKSFRKGAKVFAYHGNSDNLVSISGGRKAVKILQEDGIAVQLTEFGGGHLGIFTDAKSDITHTVEQKLRSLN